ncbi:MAG: hypothetical protein AAFN70_05760, partial [Planctomycetota bacterium]
QETVCGSTVSRQVAGGPAKKPIKSKSEMVGDIDSTRRGADVEKVPSLATVDRQVSVVIVLALSLVNSDEFNTLAGEGNNASVANASGWEVRPHSLWER